MPYFNFNFQHVQVSHALDDVRQVTYEDTNPPPLGSDGRPLKTSVCSEIEQSMLRASDIEQKLSNSKVNTTFDRNAELFSILLSLEKREMLTNAAKLKNNSELLSFNFISEIV